MMKITFKDVGQGDSVMIEWEVDGKVKIGIIDCKKNRTSNPVVSHLIERGYTEIEFIILSHPHSDHYSGFLELFSFIEENNVVVNRFGNTLKEIGSGYWEWFEVSSDDTRMLADIVRKSDELSDKGLIKKHFYVFEDWQIDLSPTIEIRCISPAHAEIKTYQRNVMFDAIENKKQASQAANYLSTLFYIRKDEKYILLTSDVEKDTFDRVNKEGRFNDYRFSLCQAPHHGSYNNYHDVFWDNLTTEDRKKAVFSSGLNEQYKHPHLITIRNFEKNGYEIHPTNVVYGVQEYIDEINEKALILDTVSELAVNNLVGGDKEFTF